MLSAGTYFTADPIAQRKASWYMPFNASPGSEAAWMADDWALFRLVAATDCSPQQIDEYIKRLSAPGEVASAQRVRLCRHVEARCHPTSTLVFTDGGGGVGSSSLTDTLRVP